MRIGMFIKHDRALDVCFRVMAVHRNVDSVELYGAWVNLGQIKSYYITRDNITIKTNDLKNWSEATEKSHDCARFWTWRRLPCVA